MHDPVVAAVNATSLALYQSNLSWNGPIGCVRIAYVDGQLIVNPRVDQIQSSRLNLLYAGTSQRPLMYSTSRFFLFLQSSWHYCRIEAYGDHIPEQIIKEALLLAQNEIQSVIEAQKQSRPQISSEISSERGEAIIDPLSLKKLVQDVPLPPDEEEEDSSIGLADGNQSQSVGLSRPPNVYVVPKELYQAVEEHAKATALALYQVKGGLSRKDRGQREGKFRAELLSYLNSNAEWAKYGSVLMEMAVDQLMTQALKESVLAGYRADGRGARELRPLKALVDVLPAVHGSAFFQRGDTHVLCTTTLGPKESSKLIQPAFGGPAYETPFFLHYDFPPYAVGDLGNVSQLNRRMIGHGNLAENAVRPILPAFEDFPYSIRVFSECTSSSGSSSMASACGASLALSDAGVPVKGLVAGVAIGLITSSTLPDVIQAADKSNYVLLTDILGMEDHYGEMDFKVAGTERGVTAIQLDVKNPEGIPMQSNYFMRALYVYKLFKFLLSYSGGFR